MFEEYQRLLLAYIHARDLEAEIVRATKSWAELCEKHPVESDENGKAIHDCLQNSLARMKKAIDITVQRSTALHNFVRENLNKV